MAIPVENGDMCDSGERGMTFSDLCLCLESTDSSLELAIKTQVLPARGGLDCTQCQAIKSVVWMKRLSQSTVPYILFCKGCRKTISLCKNTVLAGSQVSVKQLFQSAYCWLLGLSTKESASQCHLSVEMCRTLYTVNQEVCYILLSHGSQVLGGPDLTVEIGDTTLTRRRFINKPGQQTKVISTKDMVYIGHCVETKETFVLKVERADLNTLLELIMVMVLPGSRILVDGCSKYSEFAVENYDITFHHEDLGTGTKSEPRRLKFDQRHVKDSSVDAALHLMQQLYFKRKPRQRQSTASQRFHPFISDLVRVYPGYGKAPLRPITLQHFVAKT